MKTAKYIVSAGVALAAVAVTGSAFAGVQEDFAKGMARLSQLREKPMVGDKIAWLKVGPVVASKGELAEQRSLAKALLDCVAKGDVGLTKEELRRRSIVWRIIAASPGTPANVVPTVNGVEIQESMLSLDRPGEWCELAEDPQASDGRAIRFANTHYEWCVMLMMDRIAFEPGRRYRVRARLRSDATARGTAFDAGVFDEKAWKVAGHAVLRTDRVGPNYDWYDVCTFVPNANEYFWIAPGALTKNGDKKANAVWLDKISIEPVSETACPLAIIPAPQKMTVTGGECRLKGEPKVEKMASIPPEGYKLSITKDGVTIRCSDDAGAFYARMTLAQMEKVNPKTKVKTYPCVEIVDAPKFKWRGVLVDTARHFLGKTTIKRIIDEMSWYKFNVLQVHFTDDEGWTIEIPGYPELRKEGVKGGRTGLAISEIMPPLRYTDDDIREIVAYAAARHVKVVPEIEMPRHFGAVLRAYPQFRCDSPDQAKNRSVMCVGNPECIRFAEKVLDRVCELFPSDVIHIAGDECPRNFWKGCPRCQAHIKREGLKGVEELQPWLTRHLVTYLEKKGRRAIGWDEIFLSSSWEKWSDFKKAGGDSFNSFLPKTTMGMCWRPWGAGARAANKGYEIVRCPTSHCYFDYGQGLPEDPFIPGGGTTLRKVYSFDLLEGVDAAARVKVIGGQCCNWGERTIGLYDLEWKLWPRAFALSEVLWTYPDPTKRDFAEFETRAAVHRRRLIRSRVNCAPLK